MRYTKWNNRKCIYVIQFRCGKIGIWCLRDTQLKYQISKFNDQDHVITAVCSLMVASLAYISASCLWVNGIYH